MYITVAEVTRYMGMHVVSHNMQLAVALQGLDGNHFFIGDQNICAALKLWNPERPYC